MPDVIWKGGAENDLVEIFAHPELAPMFDEPVRRLVVGSTGYGLFYSVEPRGIIVHALIHLSRNPQVIRDKIRSLLGFD